ncbi:hypothetical protein [Nitrincola schmidtii]|uniref:hypothetical protein n=1 Tax=Nitrincola schmidtii TaxID=1730894 RepID=UPI00124D0BD8|nr:hypothetical protein [Nitrincola schmidtii]
MNITKSCFFPFAIVGSLLLTGCMQQLPVRQLGQQGQPVFVPSEQRQQDPSPAQTRPIVTEQPKQQTQPTQTQRVSTTATRPTTTRTTAPAPSPIRDEPMLRTVEEIDVSSEPVRIRVH